MDFGFRLWDFGFRILDFGLVGFGLVGEVKSALTLPLQGAAKRIRNETCLSEASWFHFPLGCRLWWGPEGQRLCGRLFLLTFFGEANKVSGSRAAPGEVGVEVEVEVEVEGKSKAVTK